MKLIYFGTAEFAVPALRALSTHVSLVVSQPDRPTGRGLKMQESPVKAVARELGLVVETPEKSRTPEFVERLRLEKADALVVAAYGQILSTAVLESATRGGINLHGSILPKYRGAAPIQRAIFDGETETGVTLMQMDKGMDTGDMIDIVRTPIGPDECYGELAERLAILAAEQVSEWIHKIVAGDYPRTPQYHEAATHAAKVSKAEAELSVLRPAGAEYNRFRAFSPSPGPFLSTRELGPLRVHACRLSDRVVEPGYLQVEGKRAWLGFFSGSLELLEVQQAGKKRVLIEQALTGWRLDHAQSFVD
jgi:methionyl-tRNA formyltransferase